MLRLRPVFPTIVPQRRALPRPATAGEHWASSPHLPRMDERREVEQRVGRRGLAAVVWIMGVLLVVAAAPQGGGFRDASAAASEQPQPRASAAPQDMPAGAPAGMVTSGALGAIIGAAAVWGAGRVRSRGRGARHTGMAPGRVSDGDGAVAADPVAVPPEEGPRVVDGLIQGLIASHDLATNDAQRASIRDSLRRAGVTAVEPEPLTSFDPERHRALAVEPAVDPHAAGRIARVERLGWVRGEDVLRPPEVTVYPQSLPDPPA